MPEVHERLVLDQFPQARAGEDQCDHGHHQADAESIDESDTCFGGIAGVRRTIDGEADGEPEKPEAAEQQQPAGGDLASQEQAIERQQPGHS